MYRTTDFLEQYKSFEDWADTKYDDGVNGIEQYHPDKRIQKEVAYFRKIRNVLTHNPNGNEKPLIELTDEFRLRFVTLCSKLMNSISRVSIPFKDIYKREMSDKIMPVISVMKQRAYTHVPIMNGKKVWGVFSESAVFNIVSDGESSIFREETRILEISKYITAYSKTGVFDFVRSNASIDDIRRFFSDAFIEGRRLDVLFITTSGDKNGDLVGLVTIWDITLL